MLGFVIRLIGYGLLLGLSARIAQALWSQNGLDGIAALQTLHDNGLIALYVAPLVLALIGFGPLRPLAMFAGFFLAAAALTAPFAISRVAGV